MFYHPVIIRLVLTFFDITIIHFPNFYSLLYSITFELNESFDMPLLHMQSKCKIFATLKFWGTKKFLNISKIFDHVGGWVLLRKFKNFLTKRDVSVGKKNGQKFKALLSKIIFLPPHMSHFFEYFPGLDNTITKTDSD